MSTRTNLLSIEALTLVALLVLVTASANAARKGGGRRAAPTSSGAVMLRTPEPHTPLEHNNRAVELGSKGLWADAIKEHEFALQGDPHNKEFRTNLSTAQLRYGDVLLSRRDFYNALKQYRGALYVDANNTPADQGLDNCLKHLNKDPNNLRVRQGMAEDADVSGDYETAIVEYRKSVKMADDGPNHAKLGRVLLKAGKVVDGFSELKIAVARTWEAKDKNDLGACHRQLGDILKEYAYLAKNDGRGTIGMKRLLNSGIEYRRAVTINPSDADAIRSLVEVAREALAINPSFDNHLMLGGAYQLAGDFERAKMEYEDCWKSNPSNPALPIARKSFYLAVCKSALTPPPLLASTVGKIEEAVKKTPGDAELWYVLGRGKESQGDKDGAMEAYRQAQAINPLINPDLDQGIRRLGGTPPEVVAQKNPMSPVSVKQGSSNQPKDNTAKALLAYADIESKLRGGDVDTAQKELLDMVEKNPKDGRAWLLLGNTHEKKGDLDQAATAYRQATYLNEPDAESAYRNINIKRVQPMLDEANKAAQANNWVQAASSYQEAVTLAPNLSLVHRKLSEALRQLGDNKGADKELKRATELEK